MQGIIGLSIVKGQERIVTPSTETQEITPNNGFNSISKVTVNSVTREIDENIKPENIKKDTTILGVIGTAETVGNALEVSY